MDESAKSSSNAQNLINTTLPDKNNTPCLKHAINNLENKSTDLSSTVSMCKNCSKTMLSYIFLVQEVLDNLAKSIYCGEDSTCCVQCLRQEFNINTPKCNQPSDESKKEVIINTDKLLQKEWSSEDHTKPVINETEMKSACEDLTSKPARVKSSSRRNSRRLSRELRGIEKESLQKTTAINYGNQDWKMDFLYNVSPSTVFDHSCQEESSENTELQKKPITILNQEYFSEENHLNDQLESNGFQNKPKENVLGDTNTFVDSDCLQASFNDETIFKRQEQPTGMSGISFIEDYKPDTLSAFEQFVNNENFLERYSVDGGTQLLNCDSMTHEFQRKIQEKSRKENTLKAPEQKLSTGFEKISATAGDNSPTEAFVTICRNNSEALGCLVVGSSLLLSKTSKALCVLVFDEVHIKLKEVLSSVFHVVLSVSTSENSKLINGTQWNERNTWKSLDKLNIWRLVQFRKCVFLSSDTLVLRNCDELFNHDELSAVPDNGWPDCFNSGVFVYVPSLPTFLQMEEMFQKQEHNDGDDQMFLNSFFTSWSCDLSKNLSFVYNLNLIGATTYTYATAFEKFGHNTKIVQFSGFFKPWHVRFYNETNQIVDISNILSTSIRFIYEWISVFRVSVLRLFPQNVYSRVFALKTISAEETLKLFCIPERYEAVNQRNSIDHKQGNHEKITNFEEDAYRKPLKGLSMSENGIVDDSFLSGSESKTYQNHQQEPKTDDQLEEIHESSDDFCVNKSYNTFPVLETAKPLLQNSFLDQRLSGLDSRNYEGMKVWEQGKMDYQGVDNSEGIIKRLQLLMQ